jgi:hypothetical protein
MAIRDDFAPGEVLAAADLNDTFGSKLDIAGTKILQIVRATDTTQRTTTSGSFTDVTGMAVTITPQKDDSAILILAAFLARASHTSAGDLQMDYQITDSSNNPLSGAETSRFHSASVTRHTVPVLLVARSTPATENAVTYKLRFSRISDGTAEVANNLSTGQMYAIEVSA